MNKPNKFFILIFLIYLIIAACRPPYRHTYPAGGGRLLDTNGVPIEVMDATNR